MTKFRVWKEDDKPEEEVFFRLAEGEAGGIILEACDALGARMKIVLLINSAGQLFRFPRADAPGLETDGQGHIVLVDEF